MLFAQKDRTYGKVNFSRYKPEGVKGVLLDIDNTIYHYESCHEYAYNITINELFKVLNISKNLIKEEFSSSRKN